MFRNFGRGSAAHLSLVGFTAAVLLVVAGGIALADNQTKTSKVKLTIGDFKTLKFTPGAPGTISAKMTFNTKGLGKDVALKLQIRRPDDSVAKETTGGDPLVASFSLSAAEFEKFKGKAWEVRVSHDVPNQKDKNINGDLSVTFPIATVTIFDNSKNPIDVGGKGAQTEVSFKVPGTAPGRLDVVLEFKDGTFNGKELKAELLQGNKVLVSKVGTSGLKLSKELSQADLSASTSLKVRLTNDNTLAVKKIAIVAKFTPK
jgi:hypothetical protein